MKVLNRMGTAKQKEAMPAVNHRQLCQIQAESCEVPLPHILQS